MNERMTNRLLRSVRRVERTISEGMTLADLADKVGGVESHLEPDPRKALRRARELAGVNGTVLVAGSIYLVAELLSAPGERRASAL